MFFTKSLDSIIPICSTINNEKHGITWKGTASSCDQNRTRMSWYWFVNMIVRSLIGYCESFSIPLRVKRMKLIGCVDFVRRMSSFSRHCAERAESQFSSSTQMAPTSTSAPVNRNGQPVVGTMFASNFPSQGVYEPRPRQPHNASTPTPGQVNFPAQNQSLSPQGAYPQAYQASADSLQSTAKVEEAPAYYNMAAEKAV